MKILLAILIVLLPCASFAWHGGLIGGGVTAAGDTYTDLLFFWTCENANLGADDYSGGDTTAAGSGTAAINTDAVKVGTNGCDFPNPEDDYALVVSSDDIINDSAGKVGFWLQINSIAASGGDLFRLAYDANNWFVIDIQGTESGNLDIRFYWKDNSTVRTNTNFDTNLNTGEWYFITASWDVTANERKVSVWDASDNNDYPETTLSATIDAFATTPTALNIGLYDNIDMDIYMDNIMISNSTSRDLHALRNLTASPR